MHKTSAFALTLFASASPISAIEEGAQPAPVEVGVCVTGTTFFARNYSGIDQVLLFQSGSALGWRTLAPGCDLTWEFPTHLLSGVRFEVASWREGLWHRTGTVLLQDVAASGTDALWVQGDPAKTTWSEIGSTLLVESTGESIFPSALPSPTSAGMAEENLLVEPLHTPEITPSDDPNGDVPPPIEDRPLPPV